jgi:hypothetical protein
MIDGPEDHRPPSNETPTHSIPPLALPHFPTSYMSSAPTCGFPTPRLPHHKSHPTPAGLVVFFLPPDSFVSSAARGKSRSFSCGRATRLQETAIPYPPRTHPPPPHVPRLSTTPPSSLEPSPLVCLWIFPPPLLVFSPHSSRVSSFQRGTETREILVLPVSVFVS